MKVDPLTGKTYRHEWERDLSRLWKAGDSYGYLSWVNPQTDEAVYQADAIKGHGPRAIGRGKDMAEAVAGLLNELKERSSYNPSEF